MAMKFPEWFFALLKGSLATLSYSRRVCACYNLHQLRFQRI